MATSDNNRASRAEVTARRGGHEAAHLRQGVVEDVGQAVAVLNQVLDGVEPAAAITGGSLLREQAVVEFRDHRPGKIGVHLDHFGRQQDSLVGSQLIDPRARFANRDGNGRQQVIAELRRTGPASRSRLR